MAEAVSRQPLTAKARVRARVSLYVICGDKMALGQVFLRVFRFYPVDIITSWLSILTYYTRDEQ
jgi:hypothetical protein